MRRELREVAGTARKSGEADQDGDQEAGEQHQAKRHCGNEIRGIHAAQFTSSMLLRQSPRDAGCRPHTWRL
jgi:hypothetical protein